MPVIYPLNFDTDEPLSCNNGHRRLPAWAVPSEEVPLVCSDSEWAAILGREREKLLSSLPNAIGRDNVAPPLLAPRKRDVGLKRGYVREVRAGSWVERRCSSCVSGGCKIKVLEPFVDFETGEYLRPYVRVSDMEWDGDDLFYAPEDVRFMERHFSRSDNIREVKRTCERFKWLVRANEHNVRLFLTLTYADNMRDTKKLYEDFRRFFPRLRRAYPAIDGYLAACEPQKRGAWHMHILLLSRKKSLYIPNKRVNKLWGMGFTKVQRVRSVRDVGVYLTSYLSNLKEGKRTKKNARLALYPLGFRFTRWSRDVERPEKTSFYGDFGAHFRDLFDFELCFDYQNEKRVDDGFVVRSRIVLFCREKPK